MTWRWERWWLFNKCTQNENVLLFNPETQWLIHIECAPLRDMLRATRDALRRASSSSHSTTTTRRHMSTGKKPLDGVRQAEEMTAEQLDELSVFNAAGGLVGAAVGGIGVFVIGAGATLGVASGAASLLGYSMSSKSVPEDAPTRAEQQAELDAKAREVDAGKKKSRWLFSRKNN
jgi:hypothetical protein|tara:strand:+ start:187 stop:711 length:525 start_codon:yes stop_codon:yes gene_type:complete|mmetsp:Transcript_8712/g.29060  ORF Transcript_8712/g.29060 Transcript_8712/m.29060 type:complete len:175 (-) Transcript_8712:53-577(-)